LQAPRRLVRRTLGLYLDPFLERTPAAGLIRASARRQWKLLLVSLAAGLLGSLSEGATLGVIFLAVELMTSGARTVVSQPLLQRLPWLEGLLPGLAGWSPAVLFVVLLALAAGLQVLFSLFTYANSVASGYLAARLNREVTGLLNRRILSFSFACASRYRVGDLLSYAGGGGGTVQQQIRLANDLLVNTLQLLVYLAVLIAISPWLLLVVAALGWVVAQVQRHLLPRIRENAHSAQQIAVELSSRITENIQGLRLLHSSGRLAAAAMQFDALLADDERLRRRSARLESIVNPLSALLPLLAITVIAAVGVALFSVRASGVLANLVTFVLALQRLNARIGAIAALATTYANSSASVGRLNAILSDADKQFVRAGGVPFQQLSEGIRLEAVRLRYAPELPEALQGIELEIPRGHTVALVGASGAGKSSIADLLVGLYEPTAGRILVDGVDLRQLELASWQQQLGVVSQDTFLFNATIAANIAYGSPQASRTEIVAAAVMAQAAGFIKALPEGYDTLIGERGYRLSGGQRQRLSLARAILRQPELLILDEATSALDTQSERLVQEAIERFEHGHTVLVIAHRLSTIVNADLICVMEQGKIMESGRHAALLDQGGCYATLWQQQISQRKLFIKA
jgi:subfamily B ATP-binding cassette protein MsbA